MRERTCNNDGLFSEDSRLKIRQRCNDGRDYAAQFRRAKCFWTLSEKKLTAITQIRAESVRDKFECAI
jgi:hypothetical protein